MDEPPVPEDDDIVVRQARLSGAIVFVLGRASGPDQYHVRTFTAAIAQAVTFAQMVRVRAWAGSPQTGFVRLPFGAHQLDRRPATSVLKQLANGEPCG